MLTGFFATLAIGLAVLIEAKLVIDYAGPHKPKARALHHQKLDKHFTKS